MVNRPLKMDEVMSFKSFVKLYCFIITKLFDLSDFVNSPDVEVYCPCSFVFVCSCFGLPFIIIIIIIIVEVQKKNHAFKKASPYES
jgi:hypothetical protein